MSGRPVWLLQIANQSGSRAAARSTACGTYSSRPRTAVAVSTFRIAPASLAPWSVVLFLAVVTIVVGVPTHGWVLPFLLIAWIGIGRSVLASRTATFEISDEALTIRGDWYGRRIPRADLRVTEARKADFAREPQLRPGLRVFGSGFPGYSSGWFTLAGRRGLVYLTRREKAVYIPTHQKFDLLLSPDSPDEMLQALRSGMPDHRRG